MIHQILAWLYPVYENWIQINGDDSFIQNYLNFAFIIHYYLLKKDVLVELNRVY